MASVFARNSIYKLIYVYPYNIHSYNLRTLKLNHLY